MLFLSSVKLLVCFGSVSLSSAAAIGPVRIVSHDDRIFGGCPNINFDPFARAPIAQTHMRLMEDYLPLLKTGFTAQLDSAKPGAEAEELCRRLRDWLPVFLRTNDPSIDKDSNSQVRAHALTSILADLIGIPVPNRVRSRIHPQKTADKVARISEIPTDEFWQPGVDLLALTPLIIPALHEELGFSFKDTVEIYEAAAKLDHSVLLALPGFMIHYFRSLKLYRNHHRREPKLVFPPSLILLTLKNSLLGDLDTSASAYRTPLASCMIKLLDSLKFETIPGHSDGIEGLYGRPRVAETWLWKEGALKPFAKLVKEFVTKDSLHADPSDPVIACRNLIAQLYVMAAVGIIGDSYKEVLGAARTMMSLVMAGNDKFKASYDSLIRIVNSRINGASFNHCRF